MDAGFGCLHWVGLIVNWAGWAGQIENFVDLHIERESDVVSQHFKPRVLDQVGDICASPCKEVVHAQDFMSIVKKTLT